MKNQIFFKASFVAGTSVFTLSQFCTPQAKAADLSTKKPNFVFFFADDLSRGDIGVYGNKSVRTPNIDALSKQGLLFTNAYTSASTCAPSRSALLTGCYPVKNGNFSNHGKIKPDSKTGAMVDLIDIFPTFINIAGGKPVPGIDGQSILPVLLGKKDSHRDYLFGIHNTRGIVRNFLWIKKNNPDYAYPIRSIRDDRYKLIKNLNHQEKFHCWMTGSKNAQTDKKSQEQFVGSWREAGRKDDKKQARIKMLQTRPAIEFYDLQNDPYELKNLAKDPAHKQKIAELDAKLAAWMKEQGDKGIATDQMVPWAEPKKNK